MTSRPPARPSHLAVALSTVLLAPLAHAGFTVTGNTIAWDDDGWYQVQRPADDVRDLCNSSTHPGGACDVPDGVYSIIDHTSGVREDGVLVPPSTESAVAGDAYASTPQPGTDASGADVPCNPDHGTWDFQAPPLPPLFRRFKGLCVPGEGFTTRADVKPTWRGDATVNTGPAGADFWIDWRNRGSSDGGHAEFDIAVARDIYNGDEQGYGGGTGETPLTLRRLADSGRDVALSARGGWRASRYTGSTEPVGKAHVQAIVWLVREPGTDTNAGQAGGECVDRQSVDITITGWITPRLRENYDAYRDGTRDVNGRPLRLSARTAYVDEVRSGGTTYDVYSRVPGDICETASYLAVPRADLFDTGSAVAVIDPMAFVERLLGEGTFDDGWFVANLGWEIAGASGDASDELLLDSGGKFVFECYSVPTLNGLGDGPGYERCR